MSSGKSTTNPVPNPAPRARQKPVSLPFALVNFDSLPDSAHVKLSVICAHRNESESTVRRRIADGTLPELDQLGPRSVGMNVGRYRVATKMK